MSKNYHPFHNWASREVTIGWKKGLEPWIWSLDNILRRCEDYKINSMIKDYMLCCNLCAWEASTSPSYCCTVSRTGLVEHDCRGWATSLSAKSSTWQSVTMLNASRASFRIWSWGARSPLKTPPEGAMKSCDIARIRVAVEGGRVELLLPLVSRKWQIPYR